MKTKTPYRVRNWPQYNAAQIGRGSLKAFASHNT
jgi:hypothetical protein